MLEQELIQVRVGDDPGTLSEAAALSASALKSSSWRRAQEKQASSAQENGRRGAPDMDTRSNFSVATAGMLSSRTAAARRRRQRLPVHLRLRLSPLK